MSESDTLIASSSSTALNVADRLSAFAEMMPDGLAVVCPRRWLDRHRVVRGESGLAYATVTFAELDADATRISRGLLAWGVPPRTRLALLVRPGIEFVTLVFGLLRAGMVIVLVDPGLGWRNLIRCLAEAEPEGFVAIGAAQAVRAILRHEFPQARWNVTVGRRWFWGGKTLDQLRIAATRHPAKPVAWCPGLRIGADNPKSEIRNPKSAATYANDPAAIIFTSGSTGPPKGVLYTHRMFDTQVAEIQSTYGIEPAGVDLACFPLFALFNAAMGVTTVMPEMNFSRPASVNPHKLSAAANDWRATQAFASPAVWRVLSEHCARTGERINSLRQVFSCGAPVPADVLRATLACVGPGAKMHTPYGATECLPVSTIEAAEVLDETAARTDQGAGVCVGRKFDSIEWRVIRITDDPIATIHDVEELPAGEIGELIVRGPQVSPQYVTRTDANPAAKIGTAEGARYSVKTTKYAGNSDKGADSSITVWHRTGDVGYFDQSGRFWYCGRKSQRVQTPRGTLYTEQVEAIFNRHPFVLRAALVGVGSRGRQQPVVVYEPRYVNPSFACRDLPNELRQLALQRDGTSQITIFLRRSSLPVDVRHNSKINRELLATWATRGIARGGSTQSVAKARSHAEPATADLRRGNEG
jgi:olefin beta-lactone synthetase